MQVENDSGIGRHARNLSFLLSIITLISIVFGGFSTINSWIYRLEKIEEDYKIVTDQATKTADRISILNDKFVDMSIVVNRLEERMDIKLKK